MGIIQYNTCGADYDSTTASQEWAYWDTGCTINNDAQIGYYVYSAGDMNYAGPITNFQSADGSQPGTIIISGFMSFSPNGQGKIRVFSGCDFTIGMTGDARFYFGTYVSGVVPNASVGFHYFSFKCKPSQVGTGLMECYMDGKLAFSMNSLTYGNGSTMGAMKFGGGTAMAALVIQDLSGPAPWNDYMGELKCSILLPTADIGVPEWQNDFGGPNYAQVNHRVSLGDGAFIHSYNTNDQDLYQLPPVDASTAWIAFVSAKLNARKNVGVTRIIGDVLDNGSTQHVGADLNVQSGQYNELINTYTVSPFTGVQWSAAEFNTGSGMRLGVKVKS